MCVERPGWRTRRLAGVCLLGCVRGVTSAILFGVLLAATSASAQTSTPPAEPSASDRAAAGEAYDRGTAAYLAHEYARAATLFETAYRLAPSAPALIQAIRAHEHGDGAMRAASLALRLEALYGSDRQAARQAHTTLAHANHYLRVDVRCDATCTIELDGAIEDYASFFVDPASPHTVRASFDTGVAPSQSTSGAAGETQTLSFARPPEPPAPPPVEVAVVVPPPDEHTPPPPPPPPSSSGLHPAVFITAAALTAVSGGILIWSAVDMYDGVPAYQMNPTQAALQDGQGRELRTDIMWGVTGALAATSVVLAIVTDWSGGGGGGSSTETETPTVSLLGLPGGGGLQLSGSF